MRLNWPTRLGSSILWPGTKRFEISWRLGCPLSFEPYQAMGYRKSLEPLESLPRIHISTLNWLPLKRPANLSRALGLQHV